MFYMLNIKYSFKVPRKLYYQLTSETELPNFVKPRVLRAIVSPMQLCRPNCQYVAASFTKVSAICKCVHIHVSICRRYPYQYVAGVAMTMEQ